MGHGHSVAVLQGFAFCESVSQFKRWSRMKKRAFGLALGLLCCSCAAPGTVQRIGVEYNSAVAGMTNEVTLLNILRAKEGLPSHYTSLNRISGALTIKATGGFNVALKQSSPTISGSTSNAPAGTTVASGLSTLKGGNVYTPSLGGEVDTGPSFDLNILDTQAFYQGIMAPVPFSTVDDLIIQGYQGQYLLSLLAARFEFKLLKPVEGINMPAGATVLTFDSADERFKALLGCYGLSGATASPKIIAPLSRLTHDGKGEVAALKLSELASLDGQKLDLDGSVQGDPRLDDAVQVVRPPSEKRVALLTPTDQCVAEARSRIGTELKPSQQNPQVLVPRRPPAHQEYLGLGYALISTDDHSSTRVANVEIGLLFRSPEGLIRRLGECLREAETNDEAVCTLQGETVFALKKGEGGPSLASARILSKRYYVADDPRRAVTLRTLGLVEQLINLQKSGTNSPVTVPVRVVPGG